MGIEIGVGKGHEPRDSEGPLEVVEDKETDYSCQHLDFSMLITLKSRTKRLDSCCLK